jgi:hypothetical protein
MERFRCRLMDGDRGLLDEVEGSIAIEEGPNLREWPGRFWLPDSSRVQPGGVSCLIRRDGRDRKRIVNRFDSGPSEAPDELAERKPQI